MEWLLWCARTGHGNMGNARRFTEQHLDSFKQKGTRTELVNIAMYHLLDKNPTQAMETFLNALEIEKSPFDALNVAILADQLEITSIRDSALQTAIDYGAKYRQYNGIYVPEYAELATMLVRCVNGDTYTRIDYQAVDRLIEKAGPEFGTNFNYFVARFLEIHGDSRAALKYMRRAASSSHTIKWTHVLARVELRERGMDIEERKREDKTTP